MASLARASASAHWLVAMIRGETVYVRRVTGTTAGRLGPVPTYHDPERVDGVLVAPETVGEMGYLRPDGETCDYTLHFPRGYRHDLRGALVTVRGKDYRVVGAPAPYTEANVPGRWTMPVQVVRADG